MADINVNFGKSFISKAIDLILPPRCIQTGEIVARQGTLAPAAWQDLRFITSPFCQTCSYPFEFETEGSVQCAACLADPPPFASARSVLAYDDASRGMILKFKHGDHLQAVPTLVPMMARAGADMIPQVNVIVPVPLHRWRLLRRRYNQAALLGKGLARETGRISIPDALLRTRSTASQGHLKAKEREDNVRNAFFLNPRHAETLKGKSVLLVDDVYTTGATVRACARALLKGGVSAVHVLTVARVVRPESL